MCFISFQQFQELEEQRIAYVRHQMWTFCNLCSQTTVQVDEVRIVLYTYICALLVFNLTYLSLLGEKIMCVYAKIEFCSECSLVLTINENYCKLRYVCSTLR